jgi:hypothetical protein
MRKLLMLMLLITPLMGSAALAASDSGVVRFIDTRTGTLELSDGVKYYVPNRLTLSRLHQGDKVSIQYERQTGARVAQEVERTGARSGNVPVITPARGAAAGVRNNFVIDRDMCKATASSRNPCFLGAQ